MPAKKLAMTILLLITEKEMEDSHTYISHCLAALMKI